MSRLPSSPFGRVWLALLGVGISVAPLWIAVQNVDVTSVVQRLAAADAEYLLSRSQLATLR